MACAGRLSFSLVHTGILLAIVLLPDFLGAVPVGQQEEAEVSSDVIANLQPVVRNRRNLPMVPFPMITIPHLKRLPDFWGWYKYFMDTHNQEGIEDLDRLYMAWLQNNHKAQENPSFNPYLAHLSEIYKTCANSDDPECIAESSSKPKAGLVMPAHIKAANVRYCNPYLDPYCLFPLAAKAPPPPPEPEPEPEPEPAPVPILTPFLPMPMKTPTGFYYYAPVLEPFLSAEQKTELLRICQPKDVECLQYHLRAAYGYRPAPGPAPSYSALKCNPKDPYCKPILVQKAPSGFYHMVPPGPALVAAEEAPPKSEQHCNPLFDEGCNPLTATKLSGLTKPVLEYPLKDAPAAPAPAAPAPLTCDPATNPFCILYAAAALRKPPPQLPEHQVRSKLGPPGKTKDGHDCYVHYDKDCTPVKAAAPKAKAAIKAPAAPPAPAPACHPFDFGCVVGKAAAPAAVEAPRGMDGILLPDDPHCDPEFDYNCRLRRAEPAPAAAADEPAVADEPAAADEPAPQAAAPPRFEDFLRGYMSQSRH